MKCKKVTPKQNEWKAQFLRMMGIFHIFFFGRKSPFWSKFNCIVNRVGPSFDIAHHFTLASLHSIGLPFQPHTLTHTHIQMPEETNNNNRGMRQFRHKVSSTSILVVENEQFDYCLRIGIIEIAGNHTRSPNSSQVWYISIKLICLPFVWRSLCKYLLSNMIWLEIENRSSILVIRWEKGPTKNSRRKYADQPYGEGN